MTTSKLSRCDSCKMTREDDQTTGWVAYKAINHHGQEGFDWSEVPIRHLCCKCANKTNMGMFPFRDKEPLSPGWKG